MAHVRTNQTPALRATTVILVQLRTTVGPTKRVLVYPTDVKHRGSARLPTEQLATVMAHVPTHQPPAPPATTGILAQRLTSVGLTRRALVQLTRVTHRDSARLVLVQPVTAMAHVPTYQTPVPNVTTEILAQWRSSAELTKLVSVLPIHVTHRGSARLPTEQLATVMAHVPTHQPPAPPATTGILAQRLTSVELTKRAPV